MLRDFHRFNHKGGSYLINVDKVSAFAVDQALAEVLDRLKDYPESPIPEDVAARLADLDLIATGPEAKGAGNGASTGFKPVENMHLVITKACNLDCVYCFEKEADYGPKLNMDPGTARRAVDWLIDRSGGTAKVLLLYFFGGEPLLNWPLVLDLIGYARERGKRAGRRFKFGITTNGTLLDDRKIESLVEHKMSVMISLDGPREIHDLNRPFKNGGGSYDAVLRNAKKLLAVHPGVIVRPTLHGNVDARHIKQSLEELGFTNRRVTPVCQSCRGRDGNGESRPHSFPGLIELYEEEYSSALSKLKDRDAEGLKKVSIPFDHFLPLLLYNRKNEYFCSGGKSYVAVSITGDIFPCAFLLGISEFRIGNIYEETCEPGLFHRSQVLANEKCKKCFARNLCGGGCYYRNYVSTGSIFEPDDEYCAHVRATVELMAYAVCQLTMEDKRFLVRQGIIPVPDIFGGS